MVGTARLGDIGKKSSRGSPFFTVVGSTISTEVEDLCVCAPSSGVGIRCRRSGEYQSDDMLSSVEAESIVGSSGKLATITGDDVVVVAWGGCRQERRRVRAKSTVGEKRHSLIVGV